MAEAGPRSALVTGASTGIGAAYAERLAREGYDLVLVARRRDRLESLAKRLREAHGRAVRVEVADLCEPGELERIEQLIGDLPELHLVINNAGMGSSGAYWDLDRAREAAQVTLNTLALARLSHAALEAFAARDRGALINVSSLNGFRPAPYAATYAATKAFVNSFTQSLSEELRGTRVRVQLLCPGFTRTEFQEVAGVPTEYVPAFAWMSAEAVVDASLLALRRGELVCVPGAGNKALGWIMRAVPGALALRIGGALTRRTLAR